MHHDSWLSLADWDSNIKLRPLTRPLTDPSPYPANRDSIFCESVSPLSKFDPVSIACSGCKYPSDTYDKGYWHVVPAC